LHSRYVVLIKSRGVRLVVDAVGADYVRMQLVLIRSDMRFSPFLGNPVCSSIRRAQQLLLARILVRGHFDANAVRQKLDRGSKRAVLLGRQNIERNVGP
jgi:hypothetical protein